MTTYMMQAVSSADGLLYGWQWSVPDFVGAGFPGPGSAQHPAVAARTQGGAGLSIAKFPSDLNPFAVYNFESDILDTSGNSRDLSAAASTFIDIYPGFIGRLTLAANPATRNDQNFNITGDITILAMVQANSVTGANVFAFRGTGNTQALNYIYSFGAYDTTLVRNLQYFHEFNVNQPVTFNGANSGLPYIHNLVQIGMTRISNVVQFWINGRKNGAASTTLTAPNGGTSAVVVSGEVGDMTIGAIKFWDRGCSDAEIVQQYNVTMGGAFGTV